MKWNHSVTSFTKPRVCLRAAVFCALFILLAIVNPIPENAAGHAFDSNASGNAIGLNDFNELEIKQENIFPTHNTNSRAAGNVLFDLSHNPYTAHPMATEYSSFITALQSWGFTVTIASDFANLQDYDVVIFSFPQSSFTSAQVDRVRNYLDAKGILIVFAEWGPNPDVWSFSAVSNLLFDLQAGISLRAAKVIDPLDYYLHNFWIWIRDFSDHCLTHDVTEVLGLASGYVQLDNPNSALFFSSSDSYLESGGAPGPFPIAAVADPEVNPDWRLFVLPDTNMFCTDPEHGDFFNMADHRQLAENIVFWCPCQSSDECGDGNFCNGVEYCDELSRQCVSPGDPCGDDGAYCNGAESCDEDADQCVHSGDPCTDDNIFCNGPEVCEEVSDSCVGSGNPCTDDGIFCNGSEICDEAGNVCTHAGDPCTDDDIFCNGSHYCNEDESVCSFAGFPCSDDGIWCNGEESCDEDLDECLHINIPCSDDNLWCNGEESCDEDARQCRYSDPPCQEDEYCHESWQRCFPRNGDDDWNDDDDPDNPMGRRPGTDDEDQGDWWPLGDLSGGCCGC